MFRGPVGKDKGMRTEWAQLAHKMVERRDEPLSGNVPTYLYDYYSGSYKQ